MGKQMPDADCAVVCVSVVQLAVHLMEDGRMSLPDRLQILTPNEYGFDHG